MARCRCLEVEAQAVSPPLIIECRLTCEKNLNWVTLRDASGANLKTNKGEVLRAKRKK